MADVPGLSRQLARILDLLSPGATLEVDLTWLEPLFGFTAMASENAAPARAASRFATERGCSFVYDDVTKRGRFTRP